GDHDFNARVLDSLTSIQKMTMRFLLGHDETAVREIKQGTAPADIRTWGQALDIMIDTATFWFGLADGDRKKPMHVVMTAQTKITEDENSGPTTRLPFITSSGSARTRATGARLASRTTCAGRCRPSSGGRTQRTSWTSHGCWGSADCRRRARRRTPLRRTDRERAVLMTNVTIDLSNFKDRVGSRVKPDTYR